MLADTGSTREAAQDHIAAKLAGTTPESQESYTQAFLAKVEQARRDELKERTEVAKEAAVKQASVEEQTDASDEVLFL